MDCLYCGKPAGFLRITHENCKKEFNLYESNISKILKALDEKRLSLIEARASLLLASNIEVAQNYYKMHVDINISNEMVIKEYQVRRILERKNHGAFERTGISYRRYPKYKDEIRNIGECSLIITSRNIYIVQKDTKTRKISLCSILSLDLDKWLLKISVKTSSLVPHEYSIADSLHNKDLCLLVNCLLPKC